VLAVATAPAGAGKGAPSEHKGLPCAAYSADGHWAEGAFINPGTLSIELAEGSSAPDSLTLTLRPAHSDPYYRPGCGLFFSQDGQYLAVSETPANATKTPLQIGVLDLRARKWAPSIETPAQLSPYVQPRLEAFFEEKDKLVVSALTSKESPPGKYKAIDLLIGVDGRVLWSAERPRPLWDWTDAAHDRVWYSGEADGCVLRSEAFIGKGAEQSAAVELPLGGDACGDVVGLRVAFPDEKTLVAAGTMTGDRGDWVWTATLTGRSGEKLALPRKRPGPFTRSLSYIVIGGSLSPDGQVYAVSREVTSVTALDEGFYKRGEISLVQVRPLRLIGEVRPKEQCASADAFAVDHRNGQVTVLANWCGQWERSELPVSRSAAR